MTKLFLDTEFNSHRGRLISMALVPDDLSFSWYEVVAGAIDFGPWVNDNVIPVLGKDAIPLPLFQRSLQTYLMQFKDGIHIIADWPTDIEHFCWALITGPGERIGTPPLTMEVRRDLSTAGSAVPHNALADAHALKSMYVMMESLKRPDQGL